MDEADRASALETRTREAAIRRTLDRRRRIADLPASGICRGCGEMIDEARLRAMPGARRCVECEGAAERGRGRR